MENRELRIREIFTREIEWEEVEEGVIKFYYGGNVVGEVLCGMGKVGYQNKPLTPKVWVIKDMDSDGIVGVINKEYPLVEGDLGFIKRMLRDVVMRHYEVPS